MSSSEGSSYCASVRQENVLYKVFISRNREKNPLLDKDQIEEMFATLVEPFKVNVHRTGEYGFAYFGSRRDARACIAAFHRQPPYYYNVTVGQPEEVLMDEKDLKRLNLELKYKAKRLEVINMKMRELRLERSKLANDLGALSDYFGSDTDLDDITSDILINLNNSENDSYLSDAKDKEIRLDKKRFRDKSRSRIAEYLPQRDKSEHGRDRSLHRQQNSNCGSERQSRYSMSTQQNSNAQNKNKNTRHSIATTSSNDYQKSSTNIQQRISRASLANKENIRSFSSKNQDIPVEAVPADRFVQATIQYINTQKNEIWVNLTSNNEKLNKINDLLGNAPKLHIIPAYEIKLNCYCIVEFDGNGTWYRAQVINKSESDINIFRLIDYGNRATCIKEVVKMPECLYEIPAQAIQICNSSLKLEQLNTLQKINIKAISNVKELSSSQASSHYNSRQHTNKKLFDKRECIIKSLSSSHRGTLKLKTIIDSGTCVAQLSIMGDDFSNYAQAIQNIWEKYPTDYIEPVVGDLVCVENDADEGWSRGYVINKLNTSNGYRIALIDDGIYVNNVTQCCKLLPEHLRIPDFACLCNVIKILCDQQKFTKLFSEDKTYSFVITAVGVDGITNVPYVQCILKDRKTKEDFCELKLSSWILSMKQDSNNIDSNVNCMEIENMNDHPSPKTNYRRNEVFESTSSTTNRNYNQTRAFDTQQNSTINHRQRKDFDNQQTYNRNNTQTFDNQQNSNTNYRQKKDFNNQQNYNRNNTQSFGNQQNSNTSYRQKKDFDNQQTNNSQSFDNHQSSNTNYRQKTDSDNQQQTYNKNNNQTNHMQKQFVDDEQNPIQPNTSTDQQQSFLKYDGIIPKVNLPSESTVMVALVESQNTLFVKYRESGQNLKKVTELIQSSISKLEAMNTKLAKIGKCVAAQFSEDQQWYRCEILSIKNDTNKAIVLYIDYGNKEEVDINETKMLSQTLLDIPRAVVEIKLRDLPNEPLTLAQAKYLDQCMESKSKYKMILDALRRDVQLVNDHGNFNEKLLSLNSENTKKQEAELPKQVETVLPKKVENKFPKESKKEFPKEVIKEDVRPKSRLSENISIPTSSCQQNANQIIEKTKEKETENKTVDDIPFVDLPLGKTKLIFHTVFEPEERIIVCYPDDCNYLVHIQETLTLEIFEYLQQNDKETSYKPNEGGPCIAKYEDCWYRALCLAIVNDDDSALVMFVDFGNHEKVKFTDIRKIPEQFLKDPAIAIICTVQDVPLDLSANDFSNSFNQLETYEVDVVEKEDEVQYKIRIPGISAVN